MKIALTSNGPLSGKTTLARYLEYKHGFAIAKHSMTLLEDYVDWLRFATGDKDYTVQTLIQRKEIHRKALQEHGSEIGFDSPSMADVWIGRTLKKVGSAEHIVFDSFRGEEQAKVLRDIGFILVQIEIDEEERKKRAERMGKDYDLIYEAMEKRPDLEKGIQNPDIHLVGTLMVQEQAGIILDLLTWWGKR